MDQLELKKAVGRAALEYVKPGEILGVGTGSTVDCFIDALKESGIEVPACVSSSIRSTKKLQAYGFKVLDLNEVDRISVYIDGADEIDMVINVTAIKNQDYDFVVKDIKAVKEACKNKPLKVILETDLLTKEEIKKACELCIEAKADFVKTSTGFVKNGVGAKAEDVKLMYETVSPYGLKVKASGGIRDKETALKMLNAGAERLGTSSGVKIVS